MAEEKTRLVSLAEVKNILKKIEKQRKDLLYEQRIALEHANKFAKLSVKKTNELIKELLTIEKLEERHAYKIAEILPTDDEDVKALFAKERVALDDEDIKKILEIVGKYWIEE
ncbi:MAG: RNA polymerase [Thermoplasmata archaeon]|nr:MAG: RNA polymerase [Thermoplasmata archaeon]